MKFTKAQLRQIIREEVANLNLEEAITEAYPDMEREIGMGMMGSGQHSNPDRDALGTARKAGVSQTDLSKHLRKGDTLKEPRGLDAAERPLVKMLDDIKSALAAKGNIGNDPQIKLHANRFHAAVMAAMAKHQPKQAPIGENKRRVAKKKGKQ